MAPRQVRTAIRSNAPVVTYALMAICVAVYALQILLGGSFTLAWLYTPYATVTEPWRIITSAFLHDPNSILHILFNMDSLWIFGRVIEPILGRARFLTLYLISAFAGSVGVLWLSGAGTMVYGASGAIFGLMAAYFVILRSVGGNTTQMVGLIAINLVSGFIIQGVAWQAHLGGMIAGGVVAYIYSRYRYSGQESRRRFLVSLTIGALLVLTVAGVLHLLGYF
jgi:membrane associated rhomboid family serine protease